MHASVKENHTNIVYWGPNGAINFVPSVLETFKENGFFFLLPPHLLSKLVLMKKIKWFLGCLIGSQQSVHLTLF